MIPFRGKENEEVTWRLLLLLSRFSRVQLCVTPQTAAHQASVPGILQARILEWVAISFSNACMHAKSLQSCPTLCDPVDSSPPGSSVHRILQARILEWVAISFSTIGGNNTKILRGIWLEVIVLWVIFFQTML